MWHWHPSAPVCGISESNYGSTARFLRSTVAVDDSVALPVRATAEAAAWPCHRWEPPFIRYLHVRFDH
ncbi:unnamed protein product, partial [Iphiclides podalirius]